MLLSVLLIVTGPFPCKAIGKIDWKTAKA